MYILWIFTSCFIPNITQRKKTAASVCNGKKIARHHPRGDHFWGLYATVEVFLSVIWFSFSFSPNFCHFCLLKFLWKTQPVIFLSSRFIISLTCFHCFQPNFLLSSSHSPFPSVTISHYLLRKCTEKRKSRDTANRRSLEQHLFCNKYSEIITFEPAPPEIWSHRWLGRGQGALKLQYAFQLITRCFLRILPSGIVYQPSILLPPTCSFKS